MAAAVPGAPGTNTPFATATGAVAAAAPAGAEQQESAEEGVMRRDLELIGFVLLDPLWQANDEIGYVSSICRMKRSAHQGTTRTCPALCNTAGAAGTSRPAAEQLFMPCGPVAAHARHTPNRTVLFCSFLLAYLHDEPNHNLTVRVCTQLIPKQGFNHGTAAFLQGR